jgi:ubiquinone/menaquinone biosynthesis C-methylase UbiE
MSEEKSSPMSPPFEPRKVEQPSTYFVQDRQNEDELKRLMTQDRMLTAAMGGVLPEQPDPGVFRRVLDVGCGSGQWAIEAAQAYPHMSVIGVDISLRMVEYARAQAEAAGVSDRVEFQVMDALLILSFPSGFFGLVNMRLGGSFMRTWDWPKLLQEFWRVTKPGGVVRLTEPEMVHKTSSPALKRFWEMLTCAMYKSGHLFAPEPTGTYSFVAGLLKQHGCKQVQTKEHPVRYQAGTAEGEAFYNDMAHVFRTVRPYIEKWGCTSKDYDTVCQQALDEMQHPDFYANWDLITAWGYKS